MATKNCPKCDSPNPVACKKCACGHVFFATRRSANAVAAERESAEDISEPTTPQEPDIPRRRTARVTRERPQFYDALQVENQTRRQRELQKRRKASKSDEVDTAEDVPEKPPVASTSKRRAESPPAKVHEPPAKKRRGRPPGLTNRKTGRAQILGNKPSSDANSKNAEGANAALDDEMDSLVNIHDVPPLKALQMNMVLADINSRVLSSGTRAEEDLPPPVEDDETSEKNDGKVEPMETESEDCTETDKKNPIKAPVEIKKKGAVGKAKKEQISAEEAPVPEAKKKTVVVVEPKTEKLEVKPVKKEVSKEAETPSKDQEEEKVEQSEKEANPEPEEKVVPEDEIKIKDIKGEKKENGQEADNKSEKVADEKLPKVDIKSDPGSTSDLPLALKDIKSDQGANSGLPVALKDIKSDPGANSGVPVDLKDIKSDPGSNSEVPVDSKSSKKQESGLEQADTKELKESTNEKDAKSADEKPTDGEDAKSTDEKEAKSTDEKDAKSTAGKDAKSTAGKDAKSTDGKDAKSTDGKDSKSTDGKDAKSADGKDSKSTDEKEAPVTNGKGIEEKEVAEKKCVDEIKKPMDGEPISELTTKPAKSELKGEEICSS